MATSDDMFRQNSVFYSSKDIRSWNHPRSMPSNASELPSASRRSLPNVMENAMNVKNSRGVLCRMESLPVKLLSAVERKLDGLDRRIASFKRQSSAPDHNVAYSHDKSTCTLSVVQDRQYLSAQHRQDISSRDGMSSGSSDLYSSQSWQGLYGPGSLLDGDDILKSTSNCDNTDDLSPALHRDEVRLLEGRLLFYFKHLHNVKYCYDIAQQVPVDSFPSYGRFIVYHLYLYHSFKLSYHTSPCANRIL